MLVGTGAKAEKVVELIMVPTEPPGRSGHLDPHIDRWHSLAPRCPCFRALFGWRLVRCRTCSPSPVRATPKPDRSWHQP